jgi:hypothetical protein
LRRSPAFSTSKKAEAGVEQRAEGGHEAEQLVVGVEPVGVDECGHHVEGLEGHVAGQLVGP